MQPDDWIIRRRDNRDLAQALTEAGKILAAAQGIDHELRQERNEANRQKRAIEQVHGSNGLSLLGEGWGEGLANQRSTPDRFLYFSTLRALTLALSLYRPETWVTGVHRHG